MQKSFHPGQVVPRTGIYEVEHDPHRLMHHATLIQGDVFPRCRRCHKQVRFTLVRPVRNSIPVMPSVIFEPSIRALRGDVGEFPLRSTDAAPWSHSEFRNGSRRSSA